MMQISRHEYEQLKELLGTYEEENHVLKEIVASLTAKTLELEAKLNKNSQNSGKPPSSDGPRKGTPKNNRTPSDRPRGGQRGHDGTTKELTPTPDTVIKLNPTTDCDCGGKVIVQTENYTVRQVTDIKPVSLITVEYRAHDGVCEKCGKVHKASFPKDVNGTASYGDHLKAIVTYLTTYQLLPLKRTTELMETLYGVKISQGTIVAAGIEAYDKLSDAEILQKEEIIESDVAHFDESGMRVNGKNHWLHSAGTETCTVYSIHEKRGKEAMDDIGILPVFMGTAGHDHWKSYYNYQHCAHFECNEHHLRTLKYLYENLRETWAFEMACLLLRIKNHVDLSKLFGEEDSLEQADIEEYEQIYRGILNNASADIENRPIESRRMIKRLTKYEQETLLFMMDFSVPFTNNLAERDIRMPKLKQKISGCFRSKDGANVFARVRGFVSTVKKKGKNIFKGLVAAFDGKATDFLYPESR